MPNYRRAVVPGGCWFFTVNLWERRNALRLLRPTAAGGSLNKAHRFHT
jgi:putative transposase